MILHFLLESRSIPFSDLQMGTKIDYIIYMVENILNFEHLRFFGIHIFIWNQDGKYLTNRHQSNIFRNIRFTPKICINVHSPYNFISEIKLYYLNFRYPMISMDYILYLEYMLINIYFHRLFVNILIRFGYWWIVKHQWILKFNT